MRLKYAHSHMYITLTFLPQQMAQLNWKRGCHENRTPFNVERAKTRGGDGAKIPALLRLKQQLSAVSQGLFVFCNRGHHMAQIAIFVILKISLASISPCKLIKTVHMRSFVCRSLCRHSFFFLCSFILFLCIRPGPDHGDDDRVLPLHLHHSGNVLCLLMQMESHSFSSPYRLRI